MVDTPLHPVARKNEICRLASYFYHLRLTKEQMRHHHDRLGELYPTRAELQAAYERYSACPTPQ